MPTDTASLTTQLVSLFGSDLKIDPSLLTESISLCTHYQLSPNDLFFKWEAFAINQLPKGAVYNLEYARQLRKLISSQYNQQKASANAAAISTLLKPSPFGNRIVPATNGLDKILVGFSKATPTPTKSSHTNPTNYSPFQTPSRPTSSSIHSNGPGVTPASISAYRTQPLQQDAVMNDMVDSPITSSRQSSTTTAALPTWSASSAASSSSAVPPSSNYQTVESLNPDRPLVCCGAHQSSGSRTSLAVATDPKAWSYRYMFEKKGERSHVLDERIDAFAAMMRDAYSLTEDFGDPSLPSQEPIYVVGRICPHLPAPTSSVAASLRTKLPRQGDEFVVTDASGLPKMAETGVVLESSRMMGSGNRIPIFLQKGCQVRYGPNDPGSNGAATTVGLFPGMIVMLRGMNGGGERFGVEEILMPPPLPHAVTPADELMETYHAPNKLDGQPLHLMTACGPFTSADDLDFVPWHRMMDDLEAGGLPTNATTTTTSSTTLPPRRGVPDVLILQGPFIPASHPGLAFSLQLPTDLFRTHISRRLATLIQRFPSILILLISSTDDLLNPHCAFPQPALAKSKSDLSTLLGFPTSRVKCLPNPSLFYINELVIAISSCEALRDLRSEELVLRIEPSMTSTSTTTTSSTSSTLTRDPVSRISRNFLSQRSFYPLFPAHSSAILDVSHSGLLCFPATSPDLFLLHSPSSTKPFLRIVENTVLLHSNPLAIGSLSSALIFPPPAPHHDENDSIPHSLYDRIRFDLLVTSSC